MVFPNFEMPSKTLRQQCLRANSYSYLLGWIIANMFTINGRSPNLEYLLSFWVLQLVIPVVMSYLHIFSLTVLYTLFLYFSVNGLHNVENFTSPWIHAVVLFLFLIVSFLILYATIAKVRYVYRHLFFPNYKIEDFLNLKKPFPGYSWDIPVTVYTMPLLKNKKLNSFEEKQVMLEVLINQFGETDFKMPFNRIPLHVPSKTGVLEWRLQVGK